MNFASITLALGSIGFFASRIFLPAFIQALMLRYGNQLPLIAHSGALARMSAHPTWFTSNPCLVVLGILSLIEIVAQKNGEARRLLHEIDVIAKPLAAALNTLGVISATDASFVQHTVQQAGLGSSILPLVAALGTLFAAAARRRVFRALTHHFAGTSLGRLLSWLEELWVVFGVFLLILAPIFMLGVVSLALTLLMLARWRFAAMEESRRFPCTRCAALVYPCAVACPSCKLPLPKPSAIGFFGQSKIYPAANLLIHPILLAEKRRCPQCATRLPYRNPLKPCGACGNLVMHERSFATQYVAHVSRRLPMVLGICLLISSVPVLGMIVGVAYYRIALIEPFYQYLPIGRRMLLQFGLSMLAILVILFQWIPAAGALAVPLLALISFLVFRRSYRKLVLPRQIGLESLTQKNAAPQLDPSR